MKKKVEPKKENERILFKIYESRFQFKLFKQQFSFGRKLSEATAEGVIIEKYNDMIKVDVILFPYPIWVKDGENIKIIERLPGDKIK